MPKREFIQVPIRSIRQNDNTLNSSFSIEHIKEDENADKVVVPAHRHDFYHIMFIKQGTGTNIIDFKTYNVQPNTLFFISPGQVHSIELSANVKGYVISFNSEFYLLNDTIQKLLDFPFFHSFSNAPVAYLNESNIKIQAVFDELYEEYKTNSDKNMLRALLELLLLRAARLYTKTPTKETPAYLTYQIRKLEALIDTHFKQYRVLNDYAELMHISPKHLNSLVKKGLNKTVKNLIHERLLIEAKRLLLFTNNSISEIAYELGFTDKSYFMRFFKKQTSITAETYRNQHKPTSV
ncbi:AraC family transcriptional regulator [Tenacibaculum amylolyticum]|uniref:AraC family transcriptional regulator n=1 Tax=Tenacibaculum amylolyticum TaxID=104269 RepID=UPI003892E7E8